MWQYLKLYLLFLNCNFFKYWIKYFVCFNFFLFSLWSAGAVDIYFPAFNNKVAVKRKFIFLGKLRWLAASQLHFWKANAAQRTIFQSFWQIYGTTYKWQINDKTYCIFLHGPQCRTRLRLKRVILVSSQSVSYGALYTMP